jgi:hypothetical protein
MSGILPVLRTDDREPLLKTRRHGCRENLTPCIQKCHDTKKLLQRSQRNPQNPCPAFSLERNDWKTNTDRNVIMNRDYTCVPISLSVKQIMHGVVPLKNRDHADRMLTHSRLQLCKLRNIGRSCHKNIDEQTKNDNKNPNLHLSQTGIAQILRRAFIKKYLSFICAVDVPYAFRDGPQIWYAYKFIHRNDIELCLSKLIRGSMCEHNLKSKNYHGEKL